jgi:NADPH2:quinone reductase
VGHDTFAESLAALRVRGVLAVYGAASGQPDPVALPRLAAGSLFLTRPTLPRYTADRAELLARADDVFGWMAAGKLAVRIGERYRLEDARQAQEDLEARRSTGKLVLRVA